MDPNTYLTNPAGAVPTTLPAPTPLQLQMVPAPDQPQASSSAVSQVNGPFKTHGVAGDILGHIMDMVLVGAGLNPEYTPRLERAKLADAEAGHDPTVDPTGAASSLYSQGYNKEAQSVLTNASEAALRQAEESHAVAQTRQANLNGAIDAVLAPFKKQKAENDAKESIRQLAGTVTPNNVSGIAAQAHKTYSDLGLDTSDLPADDDVQGWKDYNLAGVTPSAKYTTDNSNAYHEKTLAQGDRRLAIEQQNADTSSRRASDSEANTAARNSRVSNRPPTVNQLIGQAIQRRQQGATPLPGDDDLINKATHVGGKTSVLDKLRGSGAPTATPTGKTIIQNGHRFDATTHKYLGPA